jgi:acyl-CoA reductase-like NAD-dependent aldehyde dehydrogenase
LLVHKPVYEKFVAKFLEAAKKVRVGNPEDPETHVGAITIREQFDKIKSYADVAASEGAKNLLGGAPAPLNGDLSGGMFWQVSAYEAQPQHRIAREEVFGPVATFVPFETEAEAIALANDSDYGLSASVWSNNIGRANRVARAVRAGTIAINTPYAVFPGVPFGGYKQSGYGRELGMETMRLYTETKSVLTYIGEKPMNPFGV